MSQPFPRFDLRLQTMVPAIILASLTMAVAPCRADAPANDNLANAQVIPTGSSFSVGGTEKGATQEAFEKSSTYPHTDLSATVWYSWTPSVSGVLNAAAEANRGEPSGPYGTATFLFKGPGTPTSFNFVSGTNPEFSLTFPPCLVTAGQQYFICIANDAFLHDFTLTGSVTPSETPTPVPTPAATLTVKTPKVVRSGGSIGKVFIELSPAPAADLTVTYKTGGSAVSGSDYKMLSGSVTVPAGQTKATIKIKPLPESTGTVGVKFTLTPGDGYTVGSSAKGKIKIVDAP